MTRSDAGLSGVVPGGEWPRPTGWARPHRLELGVDSLPGADVRLRGKLGRHGFDVKAYDLGEARATADFAPVYAASEELPSTRIRELVRSALREHAGDVLDPLPAELDLPLRRDAIAAVHFPADLAEAERARERLALDELMTLQLAVMRSRDDSAVAAPPGEPGEPMAPARAAPPVELT